MSSPGLKGARQRRWKPHPQKERWGRTHEKRLPSPVLHRGEGGPICSLLGPVKGQLSTSFLAHVLTCSETLLLLLLTPLTVSLLLFLLLPPAPPSLFGNREGREPWLCCGEGKEAWLVYRGNNLPSRWTPAPPSFLTWEPPSPPLGRILAWTQNPSSPRGRSLWFGLKMTWMTWMTPTPLLPLCSLLSTIGHIRLLTISHHWRLDSPETWDFLFLQSIFHKCFCKCFSLSHKVTLH